MKAMNPSLKVNTTKHSPFVDKFVGKVSANRIYSATKAPGRVSSKFVRTPAQGTTFAKKVSRRTL